MTLIDHLAYSHALKKLLKVFYDRYCPTFKSRSSHIPELLDSCWERSASFIITTVFLRKPAHKQYDAEPSDAISRVLRLTDVAYHLPVIPSGFRYMGIESIPYSPIAPKMLANSI